jgi:hypothetical protein
LGPYFDVGYVQMWGVSARSDSDIWVTGPNVVLHYNGSTWTNHSSTIATLLGVYADLVDYAAYYSDIWISPTGNVYVVVESAVVDEWTFITVIVKFDGLSWTPVGDPLPNDGTSWGEIYGISDTEIYIYTFPAWNTGKIYSWNGINWAEELNFGSNVANWKREAKNICAIVDYACVLLIAGADTAVRESVAGGAWGSLTWIDSNKLDAVAEISTLPDPNLAPPLAPVTDGLPEAINPIFLVAKDVIRLTFPVYVSTTDAFYSPSSYVFESVTGGLPITVKSVLFRYGLSTPIVYLEISQFSLEEVYRLVINDSVLQDSSGEYLGATRKLWKAHRTKVDFTIGSLAQMFSTELGANLRGVLQAMMISDEEIGGDF